MKKLSQGIIAIGALYIKLILATATIYRMNEYVAENNGIYTNSKTRGIGDNILPHNATFSTQSEEYMKESLDVLEHEIDKYNNNEEISSNVSKEKRSINTDQSYVWKKLNKHASNLKLDRNPLYNLIEMYKNNNYNIITNDYTDSSAWRKNSNKYDSIYTLIDNGVFSKYLGNKKDLNGINYRLIGVPVLMPCIDEWYRSIANIFRNIILLSVNDLNSFSSEKTDYSNEKDESDEGSSFESSSSEKQYSSVEDLLTKKQVAKIFINLIQLPHMYKQFIFDNELFKYNYIDVYIKEKLEQKRLNQYIEFQVELNKVKMKTIKFFGVIYSQINTFMRAQHEFDEFKEKNQALFDISAWSKIGVSRKYLQYLLGWQATNYSFVHQAIYLVKLIENILKNDNNGFFVSLKNYIEGNAARHLYSNEKNKNANEYFNHIYKLICLSRSALSDKNITNLTENNIDALNRTVTFLLEQIMNMILNINNDICNSIRIVFNFINDHRVTMNLLFLRYLFTDQIQSIWSVAGLVQAYAIPSTDDTTNSHQKTKEDQYNTLNQAGCGISNTEDDFLHETCDIIEDFSLDTKLHERMNKDTFLNTIPGTNTASVASRSKELHIITPDVCNRADDKDEVPLMTPQYVEMDSSEPLPMHAFTLETDKSEADYTIIDVLINILILSVAVGIFWLLYIKILRRYL
ncbi:hypothetical protein NEIG_01453 [Nematocida sp. ERTm5]|nr:hypothetical protein NEIG_01453 [Nematocida sp. ERTm5]